MSKERLVIIGNGMAPGQLLEHLFEAAPDAHDVTIFNAEPRVNYDRIKLSPVLSGEKSLEDIIIHGDAWYEAHGITLHRGEKVTGIDLYSVGDFGGGPDREDVVLRDADRGSYRRVIMRNNRGIGATLYGDVADGICYNELLTSREDVSEMRDTLIFGQAHQGGEVAADPLAVFGDPASQAAPEVELA